MVAERLEEIYRNLAKHDSADVSCSRYIGAAGLFLGGGQPALLHRARDNAKTSIMLASHRAGNTLESQGLASLARAANRGVDVQVYYGIVNKGSALGSEGISPINQSYAKVKINKVKKAHAKLLLWDEDDALITSLNWLSKDAGTNPERGELGIYLSMPGVAKYIREKYEELVL